jgi:urease subunit alpha
MARSPRGRAFRGVWRFRMARHGRPRALVENCISFVSAAALDAGIGAALKLQRRLVPIANTRAGIGKRSMIHNDATPAIEVDAETYEVRADGVLLTCEPAMVLPMAQRYFLF